MKRQFKYVVVSHPQRGIIFRLGYVWYHADLVNKDEKRYVIGGGTFDIDDEAKQIKLFGNSTDYGIVRKDILQKAISTQKAEILDDLWFVMDSYYRSMNKEFTLESYLDYEIIDNHIYG